MRTTIMPRVMRAVKEGRFVARALHIVHPEGGRDWSKLWIRGVLPIRVPQHPGKISPYILGQKTKKGKIHLKFPLFLANLQTTRAFCASWWSSQTGRPPTRMFPSWGPDPPTSLTSEVSNQSNRIKCHWLYQIDKIHNNLIAKPTFNCCCCWCRCCCCCWCRCCCSCCKKNHFRFKNLLRSCQKNQFILGLCPIL